LTVTGVQTCALPIYGPVEVLLQCQKEGLIAHLGVAGGPIDLMIRFVETGLFEAAISHNRFTLLNREAEPFWDVCARQGVAAMNRSEEHTSELQSQSK